MHVSFPSFGKYITEHIPKCVSLLHKCKDHGPFMYCCYSALILL